MAAAPLLSPASSEADLVERWADLIASMPEDRSPCRGCRAERWPAVQAHILRMLDRFGLDFVRAGFDVHDLFSVHRTAGMVRGDACGALTYSDRPTRIVRVLSRGCVQVASGSIRRPMTNRAEGVPIWTYRGATE
jgi:hypothetical protein